MYTLLLTGLIGSLCLAGGALAAKTYGYFIRSHYRGRCSRSPRTMRNP